MFNMKIKQEELNKNINSLLGQNETINWTSIPKNRSALYEILLVMIIPISVLTIIIATQITLFSSALKETKYALIPFFAFLFGDLIFIFVFFMIIYTIYHKSKTTRFVLTNQRILITNREATVITKQWNLKDAKEAKLHRSFTDKIVKVGDILLTNEIGQQFVIFDIPEYDKIFNLINKTVLSNNAEEVKFDEFVRLKRCSYCGSSYFSDNGVCPYCGGH